MLQGPKTVGPQLRHKCAPVSLDELRAVSDIERTAAYLCCFLILFAEHVSQSTGGESTLFWYVCGGVIEKGAC